MRKMRTPGIRNTKKTQNDKCRIAVYPGICLPWQILVEIYRCLSYSELEISRTVLSIYTGKDGTMADLDNTRYVKIDTEPRMGAETVLSMVYEALVEKGYNPINQLVGYIMSGDPTYITSYKGARSIITKVDREDLLEELLNHYMG